MPGYQNIKLLDYTHLNRDLTELFNFHFPATGLRVMVCEAICTVQPQKNREGKKWCQMDKHPGGQQNWSAALPFLVIHSSPVYWVDAMISICSKLSKGGRPTSRSREYPRNGTSVPEVASRVIGMTALLLSANSQKAFPVHPPSYANL